MNNTYNLIIVDDHMLFADGLYRILDDEPHINVIGVCNNGQDLKHLLNNKTPEAILLDIQMPGINGIELCKELKKMRPSIKIILISMFESQNVINEGKAAGANGYIPKATDAKLLKETIKSILEGDDIYLKANKTDDKLEYGQADSVSYLSKREREIIEYIKKGHTSKQTAEILNISHYTVETHRKNILKKLELNSIKELIAFAYENNL